MKYTDAKQLKQSTRFYALKVMVTCTDEQAQQIESDSTITMTRAAVLALFDQKGYSAIEKAGLGFALSSLAGPDPEPSEIEEDVKVYDSETHAYKKDENGEYITERKLVHQYPKSVSIPVVLLALKEVEA